MAHHLLHDRWTCTEAKGVGSVATPVEDRRAWAAFRDLIGSFGVLGRLVVGSIDGLTGEQLRALFGTLPIVRVDPVAGRIRPGIWDRGPVGAAVIASWVTLVGAVLLAATRCRRSAYRRSASCSRRHSSVAGTLLNV